MNISEKIIYVTYIKKYGCLSKNSMTSFSFDKGERNFYPCIWQKRDGDNVRRLKKFTVGGEIFILNEGETLIIPKYIPHAVYGFLLNILSN